MELEQIIREIYRVPVSQADNVTVTVNGDQYKIINLGSHGIGINLPKPHLLSQDDQLHEIVLTIAGSPLRLKGKIVHITPHGTDTYLCGIQLQEMDEVSAEKLLSCVRRIRARLFTKE